jgi:predicted nicotinamide N-methyase
MVAGRRVLEVGARSPAVARFLLELGAARVVCAVDDRDLLEQLRSQHCFEQTKSSQKMDMSQQNSLDTLPQNGKHAYGSFVGN